MIHVAVLRAPFLDAILAHQKTIESRLSRTRRPPFGRVCPGDRIYFKRSSGPVRAVATAARVHTYDDLTPAHIRDLRRSFGPRIGAPPQYWRDKRDARYATLIELTCVEPTSHAPPHPAFYGCAWAVLPDAAEPLAPRRAGLVSAPAPTPRKRSA